MFMTDDPPGKFKDLLTPRARRLILVVVLIFIVGSSLISVTSTPEPDDPEEEKNDDWMILHLFELGGIAALILSVVHALRHWPRKEVLVFFTSCFLYALLFEDMNIQLSGDYAYNEHAWFILHNTMLVIVMGWCAIVYCIVLTLEGSPELKTANPLEKGLVAGLLALTIDLGIDATAFAYGFWIWKKGYFFGVPIVNFVGWFGAVFWFVFTTELLKKKSRKWDFRKQLRMRILMIFPEYGGLLLFVGISFAFLALLAFLGVR